MFDLEKVAVSCGLCWPGFEVDSAEWRVPETEPLGSSAVWSEGTMVPDPTAGTQERSSHVHTHGLMHRLPLSQRDGQQTKAALCTGGCGWGAGHPSGEESGGSQVGGHKPA